MNTEEIIAKWDKINSQPADAGLSDVMKAARFTTKKQLLEFMGKYEQYNIEYAIQQPNHFYEFCEYCEDIFKYHKSDPRKAKEVEGQVGIFLVQCGNCAKFNSNPPLALDPRHLLPQLSEDLQKTLATRIQELNK